MDQELKELFAEIGTLELPEEYRGLERQPWGAGFPGELNCMFGLRGENHPASNWMRNEATPDYYERKRLRVVESWMNADDRRKQHSEKMKERWASGKLNADIARKNGNHGMKGKEVHNSLELEYNGNVYYGWRELQEATGVTKHLYNKYYLNGIDPKSRIGKNGPAQKETL